MKKKKIILWLLVGVPSIVIIGFTAYVGYLFTQPKIYTELGCAFHNDGEDELAVWFSRRAANRGDAKAQAFLGYFYYEGFGVEQDYASAVKWYRQAAEQGLVNAQFDLAGCYYNGKGVPKNYTEAVRWYREAAEQGFEKSQYMLGNCYYYGRGVSQNYETAFLW